MNAFHAIILGIIEGLTEFLPISSTGHLILAREALRLEPFREFVDAFIVVIQLPAILSVVVYFWHDLWPFYRRRVSDARDDAAGAGSIRIVGSVRGDMTRIILWLKVAWAFLPAAVLGLLLNDFIEEKLFNPTVVAVALIIGALAFFVVERLRKTPRFESVHDLGFGAAFAIGFFQCLAMVPGTSRSGATIIGGMVLGASRPAAAEFSFFLAIPTMLGAATLTIAKNGLAFTPHQWLMLALGCVISFVVAYASIAFLMRYVKSHTFDLFAWYRIVLAAIVLAA